MRELSYYYKRASTILVIGIFLSTTGSACSSDVDSGDQTNCPADKIYNPINGLCVDKPEPTPGKNNAVENSQSNASPNNASPDNNSHNGTPNNSTPGNNNSRPHVPDDHSRDAVWHPQDPTTATYYGCTAQDVAALTTPRVIANRRANYQLVIEQSVSTSPVTNPLDTLSANVFEDPSHGYTGFIASFVPPTGDVVPAPISDILINTIKNIEGYESTTLINEGRPTTSHDMFPVLTGLVAKLPEGISPDQARDTILSRLSGTAIDDMSHDLTTEFDAGTNDPTVLVYKIVSRSHRQYILVATFAKLSDYENESSQTPWRMDDLTQGTALAHATESLVDDCVAYELQDRSEVDIIISMDASGSMDSVRHALSSFAQEFTQLLNDAQVDWRIAVTGVDCTEIREDPDMSHDFVRLWPTEPGTMMASRCNYRFPMEAVGKNGKLMGNGFTRDFQEFQTNLSQVSDSGSEFTLTMGIAAIDRSLPREANSPLKLRPNAAVILVTITDEEEQLFKDDLGFLPSSDTTLSHDHQTQLASYAQPFVNYLLRPDVSATVFGLYWVPGQTCSGADEVSHGIHYAVTQTGGEAGSVCQPDITTTMRDIASATTDISSGLRLPGTPLASSIRMRHDTGADSNPIARSRVDGFDYDAPANQLKFYGPDVPVIGEKLVIPYLRWNRTVFACVQDIDCPRDKTYKCVDGQCL